MNIQQQLDQMQAMSLQHYPQDEVARLSYLAGLYEQRLREYAAMTVRLSVKEMSDA